MALTREQKQAIAAEVIAEVGTLVEFWSEKIERSPRHDELKQLDPAEVKAQIAQWMARLPGNSWHVSLPAPKGTIAY